MNSGVKFKLSVMMFLQFFIWGAWLPPSFHLFGAGGLKFTYWQEVALTIAFPVSAILAMFFANQFVDRKFAAERFLAFSHFVGGLAMLAFGAMSWSTFRHGNALALLPFDTASLQPYTYWIFFAFMAIHCFFYVPTISVTNTIAFANINDAQKEFGGIRLWGTIGWIAASWPFIFILVDWAQVPTVEQAGGAVNWIGKALGTPLGDVPESVTAALKALPDQDPENLAKVQAAMLADNPAYQTSVRALNEGESWAFLVAGIASLLLAAFSLVLPHTPPKPAHNAESSLAWLEAIRLLKKPFLFVLFIVTFIDAAVHDGFFFFAFTYLGKVGVPSNWIQPAMTVGQFAEIGTMAFLGYVLKTFGWRTTMILGVLGHTARFAVFAFLPDPYFAVAVNVLHGICYAFFFATLYILVDEVFPKDARTSAQGLFNLLILGLGPIASRFTWPAVQAQFTSGDVINYRQLLLIPAGAALFAALLLLLFFHPPKEKDLDPELGVEGAPKT